MKTPREVAHERLNNTKSVPRGVCKSAPVGPDWMHRGICSDLTAAITARDEEHSRRTELARRVLFTVQHGGMVAPELAGAALKALEGETP